MSVFTAAPVRVICWKFFLCAIRKFLFIHSFVVAAGSIACRFVVAFPWAGGTGARGPSGQHPDQ